MASADATWRKYGPGPHSAIFGSSGTDVFWECDDVELSHSTEVSIRATMVADDDARREAVVWRARADEIVVEAYCVGDTQSGAVLLPDGSELLLCNSTAVRVLMAEGIGCIAPGLFDALRADTVPGRSSATRDGTGVIMRHSMPFSMLPRLRELEEAERATWPTDMRSWRAQRNAATAAAQGRDLLGYQKAQFATDIQRDVACFYPAWRESA